VAWIRFVEFQKQIDKILNSATLDIKSLQSQLDEFASNLESAIAGKVDEAVETRFAEFQQQFQSLLPGNELIIGRSGREKVLKEALEKTHEQLIMVCPWLSRSVINNDMIQKFKCILDWDRRIGIGWGYPDNMKPWQI
jgi:hypothetical protein